MKFSPQKPAILGQGPRRRHSGTPIGHSGPQRDSFRPLRAPSGPQPGPVGPTRSGRVAILPACVSPTFPTGSRGTYESIADLGGGRFADEHSYQRLGPRPGKPPV